MSYTKGDLVSMALEEIGIAEYEFDISPEQRLSAIRRLDSMMGEWNARGFRLSYPISKIQDSSPDDDSNIPDSAWEAVITNLAIRIAPSYGKQVSMETKSTAKHAYTTLCGIFSQPVEMRFPSMPKGAGYKTTEERFTLEPEETLDVGSDGELDLEGAIESNG